MGNLPIYPYVYHVKRMFSFKCLPTHDHAAVPWDALFDSITDNAIRNEIPGSIKTYSTASMHAAAEIHMDGHFDI
jgi:hypothetical protein